MAKAVKLPSGKWNCRVYDKYRKKQISFTADTKKEAERKAALYQLTLQPVEVSASMAFGAAAEAYITSKENILSPNTIRDYRSTLKHHVDLIKDRPVDKLTDMNIQVLVNELAADHSPKTVKNVYEFIVSVCKSVCPGKCFTVQMPRKIKKDLTMPSEADIAKILEQVKGTGMEVPVKLAIFCCMRRGEIAALLNHKECISNNTVTVKYNMIKDGNGGWQIKIPKTFSSFRTIPCPPDLAQAAKEADPVNPGYITDGWMEVRKKLGMESYRFHDLRHFAASAMLTVMPTTDVEKFGGWRHGSSVLQDIYTYNIDESLKRSADAWAAKVQTLVTN